jgi:hypothetical protein
LKKTEITQASKPILYTQFVVTVGIFKAIGKGHGGIHALIVDSYIFPVGPGKHDCIAIACFPSSKEGRCADSVVFFTGKNKNGYQKAATSPYNLLSHNAC